MNAFRELQNRLTVAPVLAHYNSENQSRVDTDASDGVVGAVFYQLGDDQQWNSMAFYSKTMAPTELNYEIHDKEILAIIRASYHWRAELKGSPHKIEVYSDHKALKYFMSIKALNGRQAHRAEILSEYNLTIKYRPGQANASADALTRREQETRPNRK